MGGSIVVLIMIGYASGLLRPVVRGIERTIAPLQRYFYSHGTQRAEPDEFRNASRSELVEAITRERSARITLEQTQITATVTSQECSALQQAVGFVSRVRGYRPEMVNVIGLGSGGDPGMILIDQGTAQGITEGLAVTTAQGVLVGTIARANDHAAFVRLLTHPHAAVAVARQSTGILIGVVQGKFGLSTELTLVPKDSGLQPGELLYTAGNDPHIPPGILVGSIETITPEQNSQFLRGIVGLRFAPESLRLLAVLLAQEHRP